MGLFPEALVPVTGQSLSSLCLPQGTPRLTVCVVAKNEERFIAACLSSVRAIADQLVVLDTGSSDRTVALAQEQGAEVHTFNWCDDFAAARNAALAHATGDWVLMLDADEELPSDQHAPLLRHLADTEAVAFRVPIVNAGEEALGANYIPRLFRNLPGACYCGRIHEQVFSSLVPLARAQGLQIKLGSARILHHGYTAEVTRDRRKVERNLHLLQLEIAERPDDANLQMNLGLELARSGELVTALGHYTRAFQILSTSAPADVSPELRETLLTQFTTHLFKAGQPAAVITVLHSPLAQHGGLTASLHYTLGLAHAARQAHREAAEEMRLCLAKKTQASLTPVHPEIRTAAPHHCLALNLMQLGDAGEAEAAFRGGLALPSTKSALRLDYARFLAREQRPVEALELLHPLVVEQPKLAAAWQLGGELGLSHAEFLEFALDWTAEAIRNLPEEPSIILQRAEALLLSQQLEAAEPLWNRLTQVLNKPCAAAAGILCAIINRSGAEGAPAPKEEPLISRAFMEWYRRLVHVGAASTLQQLHERLHTLRQTLPTAARALSAIARQAGLAAE